MKEKIIELRKQGCTIKEICSVLGCAKSTVSYHINKIEDVNLGIYTFEDVNKVINLCNDGKVLNEIMSITGLSRDSIRKIKRINSSKISKILDVNEIIEAYHKIKTLRGVAKHFSSSYESIRKVLHANNVTLYTSTKEKKSKSQSVIDWRKRTKTKLVEYKGGSCKVCGYGNSISALHFHHLNPIEKDFTIGGKSYSFERLKSEVDKCILVCSNCHCEIHDEINEKGYSDIVKRVQNNLL